MNKPHMLIETQIRHKVQKRRLFLEDFFECFLVRSDGRSEQKGVNNLHFLLSGEASVNGSDVVDMGEPILKGVGGFGDVGVGGVGEEIRKKVLETHSRGAEVFVSPETFDSGGVRGHFVEEVTIYVEVLMKTFGKRFFLLCCVMFAPVPAGPAQLLSGDSSWSPS